MAIEKCFLMLIEFHPRYVNFMFHIDRCPRPQICRGLFPHIFTCFLTVYHFNHITTNIQENRAQLHKQPRARTGVDSSPPSTVTVPRCQQDSIRKESKDTRLARWCPPNGKTFPIYRCVNQGDVISALLFIQVWNMPCVNGNFVCNTVVVWS